MEGNHETAKSIVVWLDDDTINKYSLVKRLREIHPHFKDTNPCLFNDLDECLDFITNLPETPHVLLFITSRKLIEESVPLILDIPQIEKIDRFCLDEITSKSGGTADDRSISMQPSKVQDIVDGFTQLSSLSAGLSSLRNNNLPSDLRLHQLFSAFLTVKWPTNTHSILFVYMRIFYRILLRNDQTDSNARDDMLHYLRQSFENNPQQLAVVDQFDQTFPSTITAIEWYKRPTFHHEIINEALFKQDRMVLYKMRFFIRHLDEELAQLYEEQQWTKKQDEIIVHRGTCIAVHEVVRWMDNGSGRVLPFDNFLSTSRDQYVPRMFAESASESLINVGVLFEMTIPPFPVDAGFSRCPFADVKDKGDSNHEQEILFSTGAVFRMGEVKMTSLHPTLFTVPLTLTHDLDFDDEHIKNLILYLRRKYDQIPSTLVALSHLMLEMGDYDRAEEFITQLIHQSAPASHLIGSAFSLLGQMYVKQEDYARACSTLEQALKCLSLDDSCSLSGTWAALGQVHLNRDDFDQALICTRTALERAGTPEQIILRHIELNAIYLKRSEWIEANSHLSKAYEQLQIHLPGKHPTWIGYYKQMGEFYLSQENINDASLMFVAAVLDPTMILPSQLVTMVSLSRQMADVCKRKGDLTMAAMLSTLNMLIADDLPTQHKAVQEVKDQFIDIRQR